VHLHLHVQLVQVQPFLGDVTGLSLLGRKEIEQELCGKRGKSENAGV
jgi:hypothetical protein